MIGTFTVVPSPALHVNCLLIGCLPGATSGQRKFVVRLAAPVGDAFEMTKTLFEQVGGFDESFPVCEDYELWLRIAVEHAVALISEPLVVKRGGHADQLSRSMWGMDRYRVLALQKLLRAGLHGKRQAAALEVMRSKVAILAQGARKREKEREARDYDAIAAEFDQESIDVEDGD